jgi:hypothetical protein
MPKRIVFFLDTVFNKRDYIRFGFDTIRARGYAVEAWDFSPVLRPSHYQSYSPPDTIDFVGHKLYAQHQHIADAIASLSNDDVVVCMIGLDLDSAFIFKLLGRRGVTYGFCLLGSLPKVSTHQNITKQLYSLLASPNTLLIKVFSRLWLAVLTWMWRSHHTNSSRFMMVGGEAATNDRRYSALGSTKIIKAHALDYDLYLEEEGLAHPDEGVVTGRYALFLDEDVPFHPNYLHSNINPYCTADTYYRELNAFFNAFERITGLSIIVAAHPRADYGKRGNPYGSRKIVFGKTIFYTKYAEFILAHASTALNFAILYKKPVLFMDSLEYSMRYRQGIRNAATVFGQKAVIISEDASFRLQELIVNDDLYDRYKNLYIKEVGTPNKMIWDIFCDYVDKLK